MMLIWETRVEWMAYEDRLEEYFRLIEFESAQTLLNGVGR